MINITEMLNYYRLCYFLEQLALSVYQQSSEWRGTDSGAQGSSPTNKIIPVSVDEVIGLVRYV